MTTRVVVVDYGVGNLLSVCRALEACGAVVELTESNERIAAADRIVVPGVGAFGDCMHELERRALIRPILDFIGSGRPLLGICVGLQMLMEVGEEFGEHAGLGVVPGRVRAIPATGADGKRHKIPHIGWNALRSSG
jgi:glutamine amidotransferase